MLRIVLASLLTTSLPLLVAYLGLTSRQGYSSFTDLIQWDTYWYLGIIEHGYQFQGIEFPSHPHNNNVAFFPGYPIVVKLLSQVLPISPSLGVFVTAHLAYWGLWLYIFALWQQWHVKPRHQALAALTILSFPSSFFNILGYTESLFCLGMMGFLYWCFFTPITSKIRWPLAILHGILMSSTRVFGIPVSFVPVLTYLLQHRRKAWGKSLVFWLGLSMFSALGGIGFLVYCQVRWGDALIYQQMQSQWWRMQADWLAFFNPLTYFRWDYISQVSSLDKVWDNLTTMRSGFLGGVLNQLTALLTVLTLVLLIVLEFYLRRKGWQLRLPFHCTAWILAYLSITATAAAGLVSLIRYTLPTFLVIVMLLVHGITSLNPETCPRMAEKIYVTLALGLTILSFPLQLFLLWRFARGLWVA
ncbi:MAG: hypothetical protein Q6L58_06400 [Thermostichales cyanobacterium BF3_bins_165]